MTEDMAADRERNRSTELYRRVVEHRQGQPSNSPCVDNRSVQRRMTDG